MRCGRHGVMLVWRSWTGDSQCMGVGALAGGL